MKRVVIFSFLVSFGFSSYAQVLTEEEKQITVEPSIEKEEDPKEHNLTTEEEIIKVPDQMPTYKGGDEALNNFVSSHLKYPVLARENGIEGRVVVRVVVDEKGQISNGEILREIGAGCGDAALKVINNMPDWNPAIHNDEPVKVYLSIPVEFALPETKLFKRRKNK